MKDQKNKFAPPSPEWFDLKRRFYAVLVREGCSPEMAEEIVRERHQMNMKDEHNYRGMIERYEKQPGWSEDAPIDAGSEGSPPE
jgi:hypothetical protein